MRRIPVFSTLSLLLAIWPSAGHGDPLWLGEGTFIEPPESWNATDGARFGASTAAGDFDGTDWDDLVVGAPGADGGAGRVVMYYGFPTGLGYFLTLPGAFGDECRGNATPAQHGASLAVGDFDGDGYDDLAIGAPDRTIESEGSSQFFAGSVTIFLGDDPIFGTPFGYGICLFRGEVGMPNGPADGDRFGASLAAGDFDGDGRDDLAIGIPGAQVSGQDDAGVVAVAYGKSTFEIFDATKAQEFAQGRDGISGTPESGDRFASSLVSSDFIEGTDATCDLAIGVPGEDVVETDEGAVHVLFGCHPDDGLSTLGNRLFYPGNTVWGAEAGQAFGTSLAAGSFGGSLGPALVVGSPGRSVTVLDELYPEVGEIYLLHGDLAASPDADRIRLHALESWQVDYAGGEHLGTTVAAATVGSGPDSLFAGAPDSTIPGRGGRAFQVVEIPSPFSEFEVDDATLRLDLSLDQGPEDPASGDELGAALAAGIFGPDDRLAIGAPGRTSSGGQRTGVVWLLGRGLLHQDGFETGDTTAWSSSRGD